MDFLTPRKGTGFDRFDAVVLALYACVLGWAIPHHLPWGDEAQSWLLARDNSLYDLLFRRLHYEGHPGLWASLMWTLTRLHLPYSSINWFGGCCAAAGVFLLLRFSPFPRIFRWLIPFTFFFAYQYAVIARPYVLFPMLMFGVCIAYTMPRPRPVLFALIAGLMVNLSLHAAVLSGLFSILYLYRLLSPPALPRNRVTIRGLAAAMGLFCVLSLFSIAVAIPAPDTMVANVGEVAPPGKLHAILLKLLPEEHLPPSALPLDAPFPAVAIADPHRNAAQAFVWRMAHSGPRVVRTFFYRTNIIEWLSYACFPIARSNVLAMALLICYLLWLWSRRSLSLALPFVLGIWLCLKVLTSDHHTGQFVVASIGSVWIALRTSTQVRGGRWIQPLFAGVALLAVLLQIQWTAQTMRVEAHSAYDPGRATAEFLADNFAGKRVAGFGSSGSVQPYSNHNLFFNWDHAYFVYSKNTWTDQRRTEVLLQHPDAVVVSGGWRDQETAKNQWMPLPQQEFDSGQMLDYWQQHGYRETHSFCGSELFRLGTEYTQCDLILEPAPGQLPAMPESK